MKKSKKGARKKYNPLIDNDGTLISNSSLELYEDFNDAFDRFYKKRNETPIWQKKEFII